MKKETGRNSDQSLFYETDNSFTTDRIAPSGIYGNIRV